MQSKAKTVAAYLKELPADRRAVMQVVRKVILEHLPKGYEERMQYGMISYVVPLKAYPDGYAGNTEVPLTFGGLAAQKNYFALYLMCTYGEKSEAAFREAYKKTGKKLDMGKSCVRFKKLEDLPLDLIGKTMASVSVKTFIKKYEEGRDRTKIKKK